MEFSRDIALGLLFVLGTVALSYAAYLLARRFAGNDLGPDHKELAAAMVTRIAALHALIIALVFAQEMAAYQRLESQVAIEASAIADIYNDAARYDEQALLPLQAQMVSYLDIVVNTEWSGLGSGKGLQRDAWSAWDQAYDILLDLDPQTARQTSLRDHMLSRIHDISASRDVRASEAGTSVAVLFWFAAVSGVVLIAVGYVAYPPRPRNLIAIGLFSAYTGVILFLIFGFSNPYSPPAALSPAPLERLAAELGQKIQAPQ